MKPRKVLFFAPFGAWVVHHQLDAVMASALRLRGCEVRVAGCDSLFLNCHITGNPPSPEYCRQCSASGAKLFSVFHLPVEQLRSRLTEKDFQDARAWVQSLKVGDLPAATFEGGALGEWIQSDLYSYFRTGHLDYTDRQVVMMSMSWLYNAAILQRALNRMLDEFQPDAVFSYHSVHMYYRIAFELARKRGIDVYAHERGWIDDSFVVFHNNTTYTYGSRFQAHRSWENTPLTLPELQEIHQFFQDREIGRNTNFLPMYNFSSHDGMVRKTLRIPAGAKIVALFGSGDWEVGMYIGHGHMTFTSQVEWIRKTAEICAKNNAYLVVRHHPLVAGNMGYPSGKAFLRDLFGLNRKLASHVRVIMPSEKITSYSLLWNADMALTLFSSIGGEATLRGTPSFSLADSLLMPMGVKPIRSIEEYEKAVQETLQSENSWGIENLRKAYRYAHNLYFKWSFKFKSFGIKDTYAPELRIKSLEELGEGRDPMVDRVCRHLMNGEPLYLQPGEMGETRSESVETEFLREKAAAVLQHRLEVRDQAVSWDGPKEVKISVIQPGEESPATSLLGQSLEKSRHLNMEKCIHPRVTGENPMDWIRAWKMAVEKVSGDGVWLAPNHVHVDQAFLSTSADRLVENPGLDGVAWGGWVCDSDGMPLQEWFTERQKGMTEDVVLVQGREFGKIWNLMALVVWRRKSLVSLLEEFSREEGVDALGIMRKLYRRIFSPDSGMKILATGVPSIAFHPGAHGQGLMEKGIALLEQGKAVEALACFDQARVTGEMLPELGTWRSRAKAALGKSWEKQRGMEAVA